MTVLYTYSTDTVFIGGGDCCSETSRLRKLAAGFFLNNS